MRVCKNCERECQYDAFYASNRTVCKECVKASVRANRAANADYYRSYDRFRYREYDHRKEAARKSAMSEAGIESRKRYAEKHKTLKTDEWKARIMAGNAVRRGKIHKGTECFFCSSEGPLDAHHPDYTKPLDVFWLCKKCHGKLHTVNGDFHRKASRP